MLVSNAGLATIVGGAHSMDLERWQRDLSVNLTGGFRVVQACLRGMRERRFGRIVVISSFAARFGMPAQVAYSASKAGLMGMVKTVAAENAGLGITANAILPGLVASAGVKAMPQEIIDAWLEQIPTGRMVEPAEIAAAAAYFASEHAGSVTGQELLIDGGHDAQPPVGHQQRHPWALRLTIVTGDALAALPSRVRDAVRRRWPAAEVGTLEPLPGGISSLTYATTLRGTVDADRRVVVKVAPPGLEPVRNRDVLRQARVMAALGGRAGGARPRGAGHRRRIASVLRDGVRARRGLRAQVGRQRRAARPRDGRRPGARCGPDAGAAAGGGARSGRDRRRRAHPGRGDRALGGAVRHRRR